MIKNILVALDGSDHSTAAADWALWLARRLGADLSALHVVDIVALEGPFFHDLSGSLGFEPFLNFSSSMKEIMESNGREILASFKESCGEAGVEAHDHMAYGVVTTEICERATVADLVILGRRGVNARFEYGMLGSVTEGVIRKSPKPVLVVPEKFKPPCRPLLAYDGGHSASKTMHSAAEFAKALDLALTVVAVGGEEAESLLRDAEHYLASYEVEADFVKLEGDPPTAIAEYARGEGKDLLFMGASHHARLVEMVLGSTTEYVMRAVERAFFIER